MKVQIVIGIMMIVGLAGCQVQVANKGEVVVRKDEVLWDVRIFADKEDNRFNVTLTQNIGECIRAQLTIHDIPNEEGVYTLVYNPSATRLQIPTARYHTLDCDVLLKTYETKDSTTFSNFIEVTKVKKNCIAGKFQVMLNFEANKNDTIRFTEGVFETRTIK